MYNDNNNNNNDIDAIYNVVLGGRSARLSPPRLPRRPSGAESRVSSQS